MTRSWLTRSILDSFRSSDRSARITMDLVALAGMALATFFFLRGFSSSPELEALEVIEGQVRWSRVESGELRFEVEGLDRALTLKAEETPGFFATGEAFDSRPDVTVWVEEGGPPWFGGSADVWQIALKDRRLCAYEDIRGYYDDEKPGFRWLGFFFFGCGAFLVAATRVQGLRVRIKQDLRRSPSPDRTRRVQDGVSVCFLLFGVVIFFPALSMPPDRDVLVERTAVLDEVELVRSDGQINVCKFRLQGDERVWRLWRVKTPGFDKIIASMREGQRVRVLTETDEDLDRRFVTTRLFFKPMVWEIWTSDGVGAGYDSLRRTGQREAWIVLFGGIALIAAGGYFLGKGRRW